MKKMFIGALVMVGVLVFAGVTTAGVAYAEDLWPFGSGRNAAYAGDEAVFGAGMRGPRAVDGEEGPLHEYMVKAFAEALNLDPEALETRLDSGETMYDIALSEGITAEDFPQFMLDARSKAIDAALADGVITQEQADWMKTRGFGRGGGGLMGGRGGNGNYGGMRCGGTGIPQGAGGQWGQQVNPPAGNTP